MYIKTVFITLFSLLLHTGAATAAPTSKEIDRLIDAIGKVESNNNDNAIGDNGLALGRYQIHKAYWQDGCEYLKVDWPYKDAHKPDKARKVVRAYLARYGRGKTIKQLAMVHNGGPKGDTKKATLPYWNKIKIAL